MNQEDYEAALTALEQNYIDKRSCIDERCERTATQIVNKEWVCCDCYEKELKQRREQ
jgi:hypothetical protein